MKISGERILEFVAAAVVIALISIICVLAVLILPNAFPEETPTAVVLATDPPTTTPTLVPVSTQTPTAMPTESPTAVPPPTPTFTVAVAQRSAPLEIPFEVGRVTSVIDGDTIEVSINGRTHIVHYLLIDAPELTNIITGQPDPFGAQALELNRMLVEGQMVRLEKDEADRNEDGDLLRYVFIIDSDFMINSELVRRGLARVVLDIPPVNTKYQDTLQSAGFSAQTSQAGIWRPTVTPTVRPKPTRQNGA